jgi:phospholipid/cholesterol/gamma-HCH transport system substrate-binding protein
MPLFKISIEAKVGLFLVVLAAAVLCGLIYLGVKKELFAEKVSYFIACASSEKIDKGTPVRISGFRVGKVDDIVFYDVDSIKIEIKILKKHQKLFTPGTSIALAMTSPVLGHAYLKVTPGPKSERVIEPGASIDMHVDEDLVASLQQQALPLLADAKATLANLRAVSEELASPNGNFQRLLADMRTLTGTVYDPQRLFYLLAKDPEPAAKIRSILVNVDGSLANLNKLSESTLKRMESVAPLQKDIGSLLVNIQEFVLLLNKIGNKLEPTVNNLNVISEEVRFATRDLRLLRTQGETTLRRGSDFLQRLNTMWPFAGGESAIPREFPMP